MSLQAKFTFSPAPTTVERALCAWLFWLTVDSFWNKEKLFL